MLSTMISPDVLAAFPPRFSATWLAGYGLGLSLILAIGAQNVFILRQGLKRQHVLWVCGTCALSDVILIMVGVMGFGSLTQALPWLESAMRLGGAAFLACYGLRALWSAWRGGASMQTQAEPHNTAQNTDQNTDQNTARSTGQSTHQSTADKEHATAPWATVLTCLALTWLNPHVYLDTVVLLGSISAQYDPSWVFGLGAAMASFSFLFALGYGAQVLAPVFKHPRAWQILDMLVAAVMLTLAVKLLSL